MVRRFTVEEANALLAELAGLLERLRDAHARATASRADVSPSGNGGGAPGRELVESSREANELMHQIGSLGVLVRDIHTGLVDFPAQRDGREIYLCWRLGEDRVAWWHPVDTGIAGRQPL